ncbi:uncharacterized protein MONBRDRAFT_1950, partial [Monosiga brevicollis MX1]
IVIDCDFESYHVEKDLKKLAKQLRACYAANRHRPHPCQLHLTSIDGTRRSFIRASAQRAPLVHHTPQVYNERFSPETLVYLTSDSPNVLSDLDETKQYVIGGLVDHNSYKGLTLKLANERGIAHARLPISEYVSMASRQVLTVNHVFEILVEYLDHRDWKKAFFSVIPARKVSV